MAQCCVITSKLVDGAAFLYYGYERNTAIEVPIVFKVADRRLKFTPRLDLCVIDGLRLAARDIVD